MIGRGSGLFIELRRDLGRQRHLTKKNQRWKLPCEDRSKRVVDCL